jgi:hypothetical protein
MGAVHDGHGVFTHSLFEISSRASPRLPGRVGYDLSTDCWLGGADDVADQVPYCACGRSPPADPDGLKLAAQVQFGDSYGAEPTDGQVVGHCQPAQRRWSRAGEDCGTHSRSG